MDRPQARSVPKEASAHSLQLSKRMGRSALSLRILRISPCNQLRRDRTGNVLPLLCRPFLRFTFSRSGTNPCDRDRTRVEKPRVVRSRNAHVQWHRIDASPPRARALMLKSGPASAPCDLILLYLPLTFTFSRLFCCFHLRISVDCRTAYRPRVFSRSCRKCGHAGCGSVVVCAFDRGAAGEFLDLE